MLPLFNVTIPPFRFAFLRRNGGVLAALERRTLSNEISHHEWTNSERIRFVEVRSIRFDNSNPDCIPRQTSGVISLSNDSSWQEGKTGETEAFKLIPDDSKLIIWNPVQKEGKWKGERFESLYTETRYTRFEAKLESSSRSLHSLPSFPLFVRLPFPAFVLTCFPAVKWKLEISA